MPLCSFPKTPSSSLGGKYPQNPIPDDYTERIMKHIIKLEQTTFQNQLEQFNRQGCQKAQKSYLAEESCCSEIFGFFKWLDLPFAITFVVI
jgi:hypothetical protein